MIRDVRNSDYAIVCLCRIVGGLSWCLDCAGGRPEVPEATGAAGPVPGARVYPGVCTQARARRRTDEEPDASLVHLYVNPRRH